MKKIGEPLTMRGTAPINTNGFELQLFDGSYKTGYNIEEFQIIIDSPTGAYEAVAKLHTSPTTTGISSFDFGNDQEIAWAVWGTPNKAGQDYYLVDKDNYVVENLYLSTYATSDVGHINYYIKLQKYESTTWRGALGMVRNLAQAGGDGV